jgi:hypothetical protein
MQFSLIIIIISLSQSTAGHRPLQFLAISFSLIDKVIPEEGLYAYNMHNKEEKHLVSAL